MEGLGQVKKIHLIATRTRDLLACSIVPQPTTLPRAPPPISFMILFNITIPSTLRPSKWSLQFTFSKIMYAFLISSMHGTCYAHLILRHLVILRILEVEISLGNSLYDIPHPPI
jgi:hypothetical protein